MAINMQIEVVFQDEKGLTELAGRESLTGEARKLVAEAEDILRVVTAAVCRKNMCLQPFVRIFRRIPVKEDILLETDGLHLFYQPERLIRQKKSRKLGEVERQLLHIVCHGLLGHFELRDQLREEALADLVTDFEAERLGASLGWWSGAETEEALLQAGTRQLYYAACARYGVRRALEMARADRRDDHEVWNRRKTFHYLCEAEIISVDDFGDMGLERWTELRELVFGVKWMDVTGAAQQMKNGEKKRGNAPGGMTCQVTAAPENRRGYRQIMEEFFHERECFRERPDTLDRMLYAYSLEMYGDMVLVEPEECTQARAVHTVAIALDTSGSCSGRIQEYFLRETKNILRDLCSEGGFENIILFQCDMRIQKEDIYGDPEEIPQLKSMTMHGFGGTDFRPVFQRLSELQRKRGYQVDCLLYLTDGEGFFPDMAPNYPTFLVLTGRDSRQKLPAWTRKIYLDIV